MRAHKEVLALHQQRKKAVVEQAGLHVAIEQDDAAAGALWAVIQKLADTPATSLADMQIKAKWALLAPAEDNPLPMSIISDLNKVHA